MHRGLGPLDMTGVGLTLVAGSVSPLMALVNTTWVELVYWFLPLAVLGLILLAIHMMRQVENNFDDLEKSRYKYKGA
ncbi:hypothetical protein EC973_005705 [Apophysomyces ossiformis]|uniref:Uncharacterized protein n=1 Tax=Apophysomyces ossiformis TaxID=679940 RepID=A0A8H7ERF5_9FUNG|nr:hypothetical protein EC973_005705 [Apophysomyces ossiformis]